MTDNLKSARERLEALRSTYVAGLDGKLSELGAVVDSFVADEGNESGSTLLEDIGAKAHQLAGSAGTFGYSNLGVAAKELELLCQAIDVNKSPPSKSEYQQMTDLMTSLGQCLKQGKDLNLAEIAPISESARSKDRDLSAVHNILLVEDDAEQSRRLKVGIGALATRSR